MWNSSSREIFEMQLQTGVIKDNFESILIEKDNKTPEDIVKRLTETILNCAKNSGIPTKKQKQEIPSTHHGLKENV